MRDVYKRKKEVASELDSASQSQVTIVQENSFNIDYGNIENDFDDFADNNVIPLINSDASLDSNIINDPHEVPADTKDTEHKPAIVVSIGVPDLDLEYKQAGEISRLYDDDIILDGKETIKFLGLKDRYNAIILPYYFNLYY
jgi:hypothetical protein